MVLIDYFDYFVLICVDLEWIWYFYIEVLQM